MARGNDAIPSWSGFNYQGKSMLLYILEKMNSLHGDTSKAIYSVELEAHEDFVILKDSRPESLHQVKATLSRNTWKSHREALEKLLQHRIELKCLSAECYFVVAKEISNWYDDSNTYKSKIELYKKNGNIVDLCDVRKCICDELNQYLKNKKKQTGNEDVIYGELCLFLDENIATMHKQGHEDRVIAFSAFENRINNSIGKQEADKEYYLKEKVYEYVTTSLQEALVNICKHKCKKTLLGCEESCAAKIAYQKILSLPDLIKYCKIINPSILKDWEDLAMVAHFPEDRMRKEIFSLFKKSQTPDKVSTSGNAVFLNTKYTSNSKYIIPTLLDLSNDESCGDCSLQETFQNIKNNTDIIRELEGNGITAKSSLHGGCISKAEIKSAWSERCITKSKTKPDLDECEENNISNFKLRVEIIPSEELFEWFTKKGGNDDQ